MTGITLCKGKGCPVKDKCYRYVTKGNHTNQAYFTRTPYEDNVGCKFFVKIEKGNDDEK